jgi:hypothetical protein
MKLFNIFNLLLIQLAAAQEGGTRTVASKRVQKYYDFVDPFLNIFINPKPNGKQMQYKIGTLDAKFQRYTNRFVKFYERCGTDEDEGRKRRDVAEDEQAFIDEIIADFDQITASKRFVRGKIGDLTGTFHNFFSLH